jgi:hypothetical protein
VLKPLLFIYAAVSVSIHILAFRQALKDREPRHIVALELASGLFVVTGVIAYTLGLHTRLSTAWRWLGPPLIATYVWLAVKDVREIVRARDPEVSVTEDRITTAVGLVLAVLLLGPGLWLNLLVALGC